MGLFEYKWNNFLHTQIVDIIKNCLNSDLKQHEESNQLKSEAAVDSSTTTQAASNEDQNNKITFIHHVIIRRCY